MNSRNLAALRKAVRHLKLMAEGVLESVQLLMALTEETSNSSLLQAQSMPELRAPNGTDGFKSRDTIRLDAHGRLWIYDTQIEKLELRERLLTKALAEKVGQWQSTQALVARISQLRGDSTVRSNEADELRAAVSTLRKRIESYGYNRNIIESQRGLGYRLSIPQWCLVVEKAER
jgi:DNA-binding response OmpR family regulator